VSLEALDHVKLLNRIDTKFIIHSEQLPGFLDSMTDDYNLLCIDGKCVHSYETLYFDTPLFHLYRMHHDGIRNRYKLRCRKYVDSGITFFEIKTKTNTRRTVKHRMPVSNIPEKLSDQLKEYIKENTPGKFSDYVPALRVYFDRLTFVNKHAQERLTFDLNLRYSIGGVEKTVPNMVVVEIKQEKHTISPFMVFMKQNRQHQNYVSKYCMGLTCIHKELKMNNFKQKINTLNKLGYAIS